MKYLVLICALLFLGSCDNLVSIGGDGLPLKYSYVVSINCFCGNTGPHYLEISNGIIVDYEYRGPILGLTHTISDEEKESLALPRLLERVSSIIAEDPHMKTIKYHPIYKFASDVYFDINENIADEEWGYVISEFREL